MSSKLVFFASAFIHAEDAVEDTDDLDVLLILPETDISLLAN